MAVPRGVVKTWQIESDLPEYKQPKKQKVTPDKNGSRAQRRLWQKKYGKTTAAQRETPDEDAE